MNFPRGIRGFFSRKDAESLLNRHNENYFPQKVRRVPPVS